ncbi:uncharacterized protein LOC142644365 [Castanea sativa]|uniref:uncharacterized protein LOC142644365 n=1 Tax=Castanea sativa TaxID=21020 RepID=UPI003F64EB17
MTSPKIVKEVQKLTGRIAALNRFVSKATDKCLPFFKTSKQAFAWTDECKAAFQELKRYLSNPPLLSPSKEGENLYLYLATSTTAVSAALIREEDKKQLLVYYINQALKGAEARYPRIEKIAFALIVASRKLRPYFEANPILVMIDQPIKKSMNKPETDGSSAQKRGSRGIIVTPGGEKLKYGVQLKFPATNNEAEYEGILMGLRLRKALEAKNLLIQSNSKLVIGQIKEEYEAKETRTQKYLKLTKHLAREFDKLEFVKIPRGQNMAADEIAKVASLEEGSTSVEVDMEIQKRPSIEEVPTFTIQNINSWMTPIVSFLQDEHLPQDAKEANKIKKRAVKFTILNYTFKKRSFSMPYLKCVNKEEAKYILEEILEGVCGDHAGPRSLGLGIKNQFSSPGHPQVNGQTEVTNRTLLKIIKAKLDDTKGAWPEELPNVLWAYRTMARTPTGETPFRLTYGIEAVIPVEVGVASIRRQIFHEENNDD